MSESNPIREKIVSLLTEDVVREEDKHLVTLTGRQMSAQLFATMPDFNLARAYNLKQAFEDENSGAPILKSALLIAVLQHRLYEWMKENGHGNTANLDYMCSALFVWKNRIHASLVAKIENKPRKDGNWLN